MDVIVAENEPFIGLARVVRGHRNPADVVDVQVFHGEEFRRKIPLLSNADGGVPSRDFQVANDKILAPGEIERVLLRVGSFENDLGSFGSANRHRLPGLPPLTDFQPPGVGVNAARENNFVSGRERGTTQNGEPFSVVRGEIDRFSRHREDGENLGEEEEFHRFDSEELPEGIESDRDKSVRQAGGWKITSRPRPVPDKVRHIVTTIEALAALAPSTKKADLSLSEKSTSPKRATIP